MSFAGPHQPIDWPILLAIFLLFICVSIASVLGARRQRRAVWAQVLANARAWAESVGGTLERVSEQSAVYGPGGRNGSVLVARRYRVTFIDRQGAQCVALLRYTLAGENWAFENLTREVPGEPAGGFAENSAPQKPTDASADSYARRHRGKTGNVPVIFAPPRKRKPPRRST